MGLLEKAVTAINKRGALLVYPLQNRREPLSLWSELYPRSKMKWEWDADSDDRVGRVWQLRTELAQSKNVVYAKWYQGRATFFSKDLARHLLSFFKTAQLSDFSWDAKNLYEILKTDSPLSTKQLKEAAELQGRLQESQYTRSMKELWNPLCILGCGEVEDSSFPSLAIGATQLVFEDLWEEAKELKAQDAQRNLEHTLGANSPFYKWALKVKKLSQ